MTITKTIVKFKQAIKHKHSMAVLRAYVIWEQWWALWNDNSISKGIYVSPTYTDLIHVETCKQLYTQ